MANSSAIFSRLHRWGASDTLLADDLNKEFDNILSNFNPSEMGGYSTSVSQMQIQTSPGAIGSESLATTLAGELERIRFELAAIQGTTYWYQAPVTSLAQLNSVLSASTISNRISSGVTLANGQPAYLIPDGVTNQVTLSTSTAFVYSIAGVQYTISNNIILNSLDLAGATSGSTTCIVADTTITSGQAWTQLLGENGSTFNVATMGATMLAQIGKIVALKNTNSGEIFLSRIGSSGTILDCYRGYFQTGASTFATRANVTNGDTLYLMQLDWIYANTAGALVKDSKNPAYQGSAPNPTNVNYWFDTSASLWKTYNGSAWVAANATLIGITVQDDTKTAGTRAQDFFASFSPINTIEIFDSSTDTTSPIRARYMGSNISVNGNLLVFGKSYPAWSASGSGLIDGTVVTTGLTYYFYVSPTGNFYTSSVSPYDRQADLYGFYHPSAPYRCVGYAYCSNSTGPVFGEIESFFRADLSASVSMLTASTLNLPIPYAIQPTESIIECNASAGAMTQILPPPSQWKGKTYTYIKTDTTGNAVTIQAWGLSVLTTTANITLGNTNIGSLASNTGLSAATTYYLSGPGIHPGTTATWASGSTATSSQNNIASVTGSSVTFATGSSISGDFTTTLNSLNEAIVVFSDGVNAYIIQRRIPSHWILSSGIGLIVTGTTSNPAIGGSIQVNRVMYRREGVNMRVSYEFWQTSGGSNGSGDYLVQIPSGFSVDVTKLSIFTNAGLFTSQTPSSYGTFQLKNGTDIFSAMGVPYSTTQFRVQGIIVPNGGSGPVAGTWGSAFYQLNATSLAFNGEIVLPILGWNG